MMFNQPFLAGVMHESQPIIGKYSAQRGQGRRRLNRPEKFNTLSEAMLTALQQELDAIAVDPAVRCVVIGARGRGCRSRPARNACQS